MKCKNVLFVLSLLGLLTIYSCEKRKHPTSLEGQKINFEELLDHVNENIDVDDNKELHIEFEFEKGKEEVFVSKVFQQDYPKNFFPVDWSDNVRLSNYSISCDNGENSWDNDCSKPMACARLVKKCLEQGGCANICSARIVYYRPMRYFLIKRRYSMRRAN